MSVNYNISQESTWIFGVWSLTLIREDYIALYVDTVKTVAVREDPSRFFVVSRFLSFKPQFFKLNFIISSPSNGVASEEAGYIADNPQSSLWGDTHHYDYKWLGNQINRRFHDVLISGQITGSGKIIRRRDLPPNMGFKHFQPSQCWSR